MLEVLDVPPNGELNEPYVLVAWNDDSRATASVSVMRHSAGVSFLVRQDQPEEQFDVEIQNAIEKAIEKGVSRVYVDRRRH